MLRDRGREAVEVRAALAQDAPDDAVAAYAAARHMVLVTHDPGCARKARALVVQHVWLRTREWQDRDRLREALPQVEAMFQSGAVRVTLFNNVIRRD